VIEVQEARHLLCQAILPALGTADPALQIRVDISVDGAVTWLNGWKVITIPAYEPGTHWFELHLPHRCRARLSCRDVLADADTTCTIYADARTQPIGELDEPAFELESAGTNGVIAWSDGAGAADALGLAFAAGPVGGTQWIPVGRATELEIWAVTTNGPPTSIEIQIDTSPDPDPALVPIAALPAVNAIAAGIANLMPLQVQFQSAAGTLANGTYVSQRIALQPHTWIRAQAKRTGAAVDLLAHFRLYRPEL
jgi:hypothetical protein